MTTHAPQPSVRSLLTLAWPIVVSRSTQVVVGLCDALMVASLGEDALAATTTGALNTYSVLILPMGIVFIVQSYSAQLFGRGDEAGARRFGWYGLMVAVATQLLCFLTLPFVAGIVGLFRYAPGVEQELTNYLTWRLPAAGAVVGMEALANLYGGLGNTRLPMRASLLAMALNVLGNWILIDGHLGAPALGVRGAALASALSTGIAFLFLAWRFILDGRRFTAGVPLSGHEFARMLRFGVPSGLNWFVEFFAFAFYVNVVVGGLGTTVLAAFMAVIQINSLSFMPAFGLASAGAIQVGQAIGAKRKDLVARVVLTTFVVAAAWQGFVGLLYVSLPTLLLRPFGAAGEAFTLTGAGLLAISAAWQVFDSGAMTLAESLRAAGDTNFTMWARLALAWLVFVPGSLLCARYLGWAEKGAAFWLVLYLALLAGVLFLRFRSGAWRNIRITETEL